MGQRERVVTWHVVINGDRLDLVDAGGVVVADMVGVTRRAARLLSEMAFDRGADEVRFDFDLKVIEQ